MKRMILAIYLMLSVTLISCAGTTTYVLEGRELVHIETGETYVATFDGWIFSERAVKRIMDTEVKATNLK